MASDATEPHQVEANLLDPPVNHIGRSTICIENFIQNQSNIINSSAILHEICKGYNDTTWCYMIQRIAEFKQFSFIDGLLCCSDESGIQCLVIPKVKHKGEGIRGLLIQNLHKIIGHYSSPRTLEYMRKYYWWPTMAKDVEKFCKSCKTCQTTKRWMTRLHGLLHNLLIPDHPWSGIAMDFVGPFPESLGKDYLWVQYYILPSYTILAFLQ